MNSMETPILFIHGISDLGGAERELLLIVERLGSSGYIPSVVLGSDGPLREELHRRKIETLTAPLPPWRKLWGFWRRQPAVRALRDVIGRAKPAVVHVNDIWWVPQTLQATTSLGIPVVGHVRQEIEPDKVRRYGLDRLDSVLAVSHQVRRSLEQGGVPQPKIVTVHSGLGDLPDGRQLDGRALRDRLGIPDEAPVIGTVANLFPRKGYEVMLRAVREVVRELPAVQYVVVGGGNPGYEQQLKTLAQSMKVENRVHFAGAQQSVYPYLAMLNLYVHPALMEGFGIAVLEAMAMGKAVVATKTGGVPEIVMDGETGLLVEPNNVAALSEAVLRLLTDPEQCSRMGQAGCSRVRTVFTVEAMMQQLVEVYRGLLHPERNPSFVVHA